MRAIEASNMRERMMKVIQDNPDLTAKAISERFGCSPHRIYTLVKKNGVSVGHERIRKEKVAQ